VDRVRIGAVGILIMGYVCVKSLILLRKRLKIAIIVKNMLIGKENGIMIRVVIESPYAGEIIENVEYAKRAMLDCFKREEAPFASHLLYTQKGLLKDDSEKDRELGIGAGVEWGFVANKAVVYYDLGISDGMQHAINLYLKRDMRVEFRSIGSAELQ